MGQSESDMNGKLGKKDSRFPSQAEPDVTYADIKFKTTSAPRVRTDRDGLNTTYAELNIRKKETRIDEDSPIASGTGGLSPNAQAAEPDISYAEVNFKTRSAPRVRTDRAKPDALYADIKFKTASATRSRTDRAKPDVSYAEVNFKTNSASQVRTDRDGLNTTYSELNIRKKETRFVEEKDPPISSEPVGVLTTAQTAAQERESKGKVGNRPYRLICLLCLVTFTLIATVAGLLIYVLQIRQTKTSSDQNCHEINSTLQSKISENSHLNLSQRTCLKDISALDSNLSDFNRMHSDLRQQFTEMETKYRSVNNATAKICELLTCKREQECSQDWIRNEGGCYFLSTSNLLYNEARQYCSNNNASLLEINSPEEQNFTAQAVREQGISYWIGKCECGKVTSNVLYQIYGGDAECGECTLHRENKPCDQVHARFICEKSAPSCPDIPEKIQVLCQQRVGPT